MKTDVIKIDPESPQPSDVKKAAGTLRAGGIVAVPTETVYGLAVSAKDQKALDRLYAIKKRPKDKPFAIQIAGLSQVKDYAGSVSRGLKDILEKFWPGPLTVIVSTGGSKVGLRMPENEVTLAIIDEAGFPLAVTSANLSGEKAVSSAGEVAKIFNGRIDLIVDDGRVAQGVESTVLDCTTFPFKILRKGAISEEIKEFMRGNK